MYCRSSCCYCEFFCFLGFGFFSWFGLVFCLFISPSLSPTYPPPPTPPYCRKNILVHKPGLARNLSERRPCGVPWWRSGKKWLGFRVKTSKPVPALGQTVGMSGCLQQPRPLSVFFLCRHVPLLSHQTPFVLNSSCSDCGSPH